MHALLDASLRCESLESVPDVGGIDGATVERAEERGAALDPEGFPLSQPTLDEGEGTGVEADRASAVALAVQDAHSAVFAVHVLRMERQRLGDAQTASVEHSQERGVANSCWCAARTGPKQGAGFIGGQGLRR
jgi:hypothetical protein